MSSAGEKFTDGFVDAALTVYFRVLADDECRAIIMDAENTWGKRTPWDSVYKLEAIAKKCGQREQGVINLRWVLHGVTDLVTNGYQPASAFSARALSGKGMPNNEGMADLILHTMQVMKYGLASVLAPLNYDSEGKELVA
eukprot:2051243-Pyramimonas_sp.AAC.1